METKQEKTLKKKIYFSGKGIHSGRWTYLELHPAKENSGIRFFKKNQLIHAHLKNTVSSPFRILLKQDKEEISTIEHLLGCLYIFGITNCHIYIKGDEIPIFDGSALFFAKKIQEVGVKVQKKTQKVIRIKRFKKLSFKKSFISVSSSSNLKITFEIDGTIASKKSYTFYCSKKNLINTEDQKILSARTFGFLKDHDRLKSLGFGYGATKWNLLALDEYGKTIFLKKRFKDELICHKILDFLGMLALIPFKINGAFYLKNAGHYFENIFLKKIFKKILK